MLRIYFTISLLVLAACSSSDTKKISEDGKQLVVMKAEKILSRPNPFPLYTNTAAGLHFEYDQKGILKGDVLYTYSINDPCYYFPGDRITFTTQTNGKKFTYIFNEWVNKRRNHFQDGGLPIAAPYDFLEFDMPMCDLENIVKDQKITVSLVSSRAKGDFEGELPAEALNTMKDFVKKTHS